MKIKMDANQLLRTGSDPDEWFRLSKSHWLSARYLSEKSFAVMPKSNGKVQRLDHDWIEDYFDFAVTAHLLYGYALETAIKATIIRIKPDAVEFELTTNATTAKLKRFGNNMNNWHSIAHLADIAELFREGFASPEDREYLNHFTDAVVWSSKYPIPKASSKPNDRDTLFAIRTAEKWLLNLHPEPLPEYKATALDRAEGG